MGTFKLIHANIKAALKATGIVDGESTLNRNAKSAALSAFEGTKQRFFGHLLTGMKCPELIRAIEDDLGAGRAAVIQLVSTGEALMERRVTETPASEWDDLTIDLTPRDGILSFLMHAFPVHLQEPFTDDDGNLMSRPVTDADGNPVICREAEARREALIQKLAALPPVPTALDRIVQHFGHEAVAEVTGRSRRVLRIADGQGERETMARAELDASAWRRAGEAAWRAAWDAETASLPSHRDSRFWLATGLLLPVWDRLPAETMRVRRLTAAGGIALIGRVLDAGKVRAVRAAFGLAGGPAMTGAEAFEAVMDRGAALPLANGWRLARRRIMGAARVEIEGPTDTDVPALKCLGCTVEIVFWCARVFAPDAGVLDRILERRPLAE